MFADVPTATQLTSLSRAYVVQEPENALEPSSHDNLQWAAYSQIIVKNVRAVFVPLWRRVSE